MVRRNRYKFRPPQVQPLRRGNDDFREIWASCFWGNVNINKDDYYRMVGGVMNWDNIMARKTYRIELKIDFNEESTHEVLIGIAKQYARDLLASAMLLQDGRKPAVVLMTDDSFHGVEEIDVMAASDEIHS